MKKKIGYFIVLLLIGVIISACGNDKDSKRNTPNGDPDSNSESNGWLKEAKLNETETVEELYEKAKEEGKVVVYSHTSLISDVKENFEKEYPGIEVEDYTLYGAEMLEKIKREHEAGVHNVDVIAVKNLAGSLDEVLLKDGILHNYTPSDIQEKMVSPYDKSDKLIQYVEYRAIFYNSDVYDESPIDNWWDLTTDEWNERLVIINPLNSTDTMDLFIAMVNNSDDMAEAYKEKFGEEIELDGTENAGYEFIKRLANNGISIVDSSAEATDAVANSQSDNPPVTIAISSKLKDVVNQGYPLASPEKMSPKLGVKEDSGIFISDEAPNINAAKLMARWLAGEADGKAGGLHTWDAPGNWHVREDTVNTADENQTPLEELDLWEYDSKYHYEEANKIMDFWLKHQL